eukprot:GHVP01060186.1.p1 GENE.GHVP01060186.1~~GHVP01060186.1.p1  ORF type:complete len:368 (+),score=53.53 GHVP01060186.1:299-1402(+)
MEPFILPIPIHLFWTRQEDLNIQFLEDHIFRTSTSSEKSTQAFAMYNSRPQRPIPYPKQSPIRYPKDLALSQMELSRQTGSAFDPVYPASSYPASSSGDTPQCHLSSTSASSSEKATWKEILKKASLTTSIKITPGLHRHARHFAILFKDQGENKLFEIRLQKNCLNLEIKNKKKSSFNPELILDENSQQIDLGDVKSLISNSPNSKIQELGLILKFPSKEAAKDHKYIPHDDTYGLSWAGKVTSEYEMYCRQNLKNGEFVFIVPDDFQPMKLGPILATNSGKWLVEEKRTQVQNLCCLRKRYKIESWAGSIDVVRFQFPNKAKPKTYLFRSDFEYPNLFYQIKIPQRSLPNEDLLKSLNEAAIALV